MKTFTKLLKHTLLLGVFFLASKAEAATFTAVASGDWTSSATWQGGVAPGTVINADDDIIIGSGLTVNLDQDVTLNGLNVLVPGGSITVNGALTSTNNSALYMNNGDLSGFGNLDIDRLEFSGLSTFSFTGSSTIGTLANSNTTLNIVSILDITDTLSLDDGMVSLGTNATLDLQTNSTVKVDMGSITTSGGIFGSANSYSVIYVGPSKTTGIEATGSGLTDVYVQLNDNTQSLSLGSNITVTGTLDLSSGNLAFNNMDLTLSGDLIISGGAEFVGDSNAKLIVESNSTLSSALVFSQGTEMLSELVVDFSGGGTLTLASDLGIDSQVSLMSGDLNLDGGSTLMMNSGSDIMIDNGSLLVSNGNFDGSASYNVSYTGSSKAVGVELNGSGLNDLTINLDNITDNVTLNSSASVNGMLDIQQGAVMLAGNTLEINGDFMSESNAGVSGDANAKLVVNAAGQLSDTINFVTNGEMLQTLELNFGSNAEAMINGDLHVDTLMLSSGSVVLFDNSLSINNDGVISNADESNYIMIDGEGTLNMTIDGNADGYVKFPIGTTDDYAPAYIELVGSQSSEMMVNIADGVLVNGSSGTDLSMTQSVVDKTWDIYSSTGSNTAINLKLSWNTAMEVNGFDRTNAYISHYTNANWDGAAAGSATTNAEGMFELSRNNISSLSPFAVTDNNSSVSVEELEGVLISLYPNPVVNELFVETNQIDNTTFDIIDLTGKVVWTMSQPNTTTQVIDVEGFKNGVYFLRVINDGKTTVKRFVKS